MPSTRVIFFQDEAGHAPVVAWLQHLQKENAKAWANCRARIVLLSQFGHELRRPAVDFLRDGIYELRAKQGHVQYRILYFFHAEMWQCSLTVSQKRTRYRRSRLKER
jgi:putative component of toxin-antitoxin plasmid stabilization module